MALIRIRERPDDEGSNAVVIFDHGEEYRILITNPFSDEKEDLLRRYFGEHSRSPFTGQVKAQEIEVVPEIINYGQTLFNQVFADRAAYARYQEALQSGIETLRFEIAGSPEFQRLHWETLKDPDLDRPLSLHTYMVRKNLEPRTVQAEVRKSPTINLLMVVAQPGSGQDIGYRTLSRPLVDGLRLSGLRVRIEILRPGTFKALLARLEAVRDEHGSGFFHILHFDVPGVLLTSEDFQHGVKDGHFSVQKGGSNNIEPYESSKAFLLLEGRQEGIAEPIDVEQIAKMLITYQIPIVILNASQSGNGPSATTPCIGSQLMCSGAQMVMAMRYPITITAATLLTRTLYDQFFAGQDLASAVRRARSELYNDKTRPTAIGAVDVEDWLLPIVYQNREQYLQVREFTPEERTAYYKQQAARFPFPGVTYDFVGRDLDIFQIERRLLTERNLLLVHGLGGVGKTTLLQYLGAWWQITGFVEEVFYFGFDKQAWTCKEILDTIGGRILSSSELVAFLSYAPHLKQAMLTERLRARRHLLVLDNLESITDTPLAIRNSLPKEERVALHALLTDLVDGKTLVLLGSRGPEGWLAEGTFKDNIHQLSGLDPEAVSSLASSILKQHGAIRYHQDQDFRRLLELLSGCPRALEVVLPQLANHKPSDILLAWQVGAGILDEDDSREKTEVILQAIELCHSNLAPDHQQLLTCLAPFAAVVNVRFSAAGTLPLVQYTSELRQQVALSGLPFESWSEAIDELVRLGLANYHHFMHGFLHLEPILTHFLRNRLNLPEQADVRRAVEAAFCQLYRDVSNDITKQLQSTDPHQAQLGRLVVTLEYENLIKALCLALKSHSPILDYCKALFAYLDVDTIEDQRRGLDLGRIVLTHVDDYPIESLQSSLGQEFITVLSMVSSHQLLLKVHEAAKESLDKRLRLIRQQEDMDEELRNNMAAAVQKQLEELDD